MKLQSIRRLSYEDLASYTDNFSESNYLGPFQFGRLYHGKIQLECVQYVMVKLWEEPKIYAYFPGENERRLMDEVILLQHQKLDHPGMLKLYGYCFEGDDRLGVVYKFKPFDSVFNLVPKDGFTWLRRIKVSLQFASLLSFLHSVRSSSYKPFIVRNLDCAHVVLDEEYNPKLCDFGLITGGIFPDRTIYKGHPVSGCYGYIDLSALGQDDYTVGQDVFAFGSILLSLISKRLFTEEERQAFGPTVPRWAWAELLAYEDSETGLKRPKFSLVHQSLAADPDFIAADGHKITALALDCTKGDLDERPNIKQVLRSLLKLKVVKKNADFLGVDKLLSSPEKVV